MLKYKNKKEIKMKKISIVKGDITQIEVSAIVNSTNKFLRPGFGVDSCIHSVGGEKIAKNLKSILLVAGEPEEGTSVVTTGGLLPASYVVHAIAPSFKDGEHNERELLFKTYISCFDNFEKYEDIKTVSFPCIGTGVYDFPKDEAASIALKAIKNCLSKSKNIEQVIIVCYDDENYDIYKELIKNM